MNIENLEINIMKHILNNLTVEEKNSILEQHTGGMKVMNENFSKLISSKLGDVKPLVNEQVTNPKEEVRKIFNKAKSMHQSTGIGQQPALSIDWATSGFGTNEEDIVKEFSELRRLADLSSLIDYWSKYHPYYHSSDLFNHLDTEIDLDSDWVKILKPLQKLK